MHFMATEFGVNGVQDRVSQGGALEFREAGGCPRDFGVLGIKRSRPLVPGHILYLFTFLPLQMTWLSSLGTSWLGLS
jgi:hypothetical protein